MQPIRQCTGKALEEMCLKRSTPVMRKDAREDSGGKNCKCQLLMVIEDESSGNEG